MLKTYKYRLYPNKEVTSKLYWTLARCRELYNAALSERKDSYQKHQRTILYQNEQGRVIAVQMEANMKVKDVRYLQQKRDLVEIKELREEYQEIASHVLQDVLLRLEKGMKAFFRRINEGQTPGFPRFQRRNRYNSFTYPDGAGWKLHGNTLHLSKMGDIKVKLHRPIEGTMKTCTMKQEGDQWYVTFLCEIPDEEVGTHLPYTDGAIGIDLGLLHFATLSTGDTIENPRFFRKAQADLKRKQQHKDRCQRGSHRREKARQQVAQAQRKTKNLLDQIITPPVGPFSVQTERRTRLLDGCYHTRRHLASKEYRTLGGKRHCVLRAEWQLRRGRCNDTLAVRLGD